LFSLHRFAYFFRRRYDDVVAGGSRAKRIMSGADAADRPAGHPNPRPANFTQSGTLFLSQGPRAILVKFDIRAGGNSQMEIKLAMKILQVAMTIDEAGQNGLAPDINHLGVGRNGDFAVLANHMELAGLDNNDAILNGLPAGAIDQFSTLHHECFLCHVFFSSCPDQQTATRPPFLLTLREGLPFSSRRSQLVRLKYLMSRFTVNAGSVKTI